MQDPDMDILSKLKQIIKVINNSRNGYALAAEKENNNSLKASLVHFMQERETYINEIKQLILEQGGTIGDAFAPAEDHPSAWMDILAANRDNNKEAIIAACINGEREVIKIYQIVLQNDAVDASIRSILSGHLSGLEYAVRKINTHLTPTF